MKNPFTMLFASRHEKLAQMQRKIALEEQKKAGTPADTRRGKGGGGTAQPKVTITEEQAKTPKYYRKNRTVRVSSIRKRREKRLAQNRQARRSRRINRIYAKH